MKKILWAASGLVALLLPVISQASGSTTRINETYCDRLDIEIRGYEDAERLFLALPEKSESYSDSALERRLELASSHDSISILCSLSSGRRGICSLLYKQNSATTDTCAQMPEAYFLTRDLSARLARSLKLEAGSYTTGDRVLEIGCATVPSSGTECTLDIGI